MKNYEEFGFDELEEINKKRGGESEQSLIKKNLIGMLNILDGILKNYYYPGE